MRSALFRMTYCHKYTKFFYRFASGVGEEFESYIDLILAVCGGDFLSFSYTSWPFLIIITIRGGIIDFFLLLFFVLILHLVAFYRNIVLLEGFSSVLALLIDPCLLRHWYKRECILLQLLRRFFFLWIFLFFSFFFVNF